MAAGAVACLVLAALVAFALRPGPHVVLPRAVEDRVASPAGDGFSAAARLQTSSHGRAHNVQQLAYRSAGLASQEPVVVLAGDTSMPTKHQQQQFVAGALRQTGSTVAPQAPGARGGVMSCGVHLTNGIAFAECAWADRGTFGMVLEANVDVATLAGFTRDLRVAAEH